MLMPNDRWLPVALAACLACEDPTAPKQNVAIEFCLNEPSFIVVQNEGDVWRRYERMGREFHFPATSRLGLAFIDGATPTSSHVEVYYLGVDELSRFQCPPSGSIGAKSHTGTVAGLPSGHQATILMGAGIAHLSANGSYTLNNVWDSPTDLFAGRNRPFDRIIIRRSLNLPHGAAIPLLDFASAEAFSPVTHTLTSQGVGENATISQTWSLSGTGVHFAYTPLAATNSIFTMPADRQQVGDAYGVSIDEFILTTEEGRARSAAISFTAGANRTLDLGPPAPTPVRSMTRPPPHARFQYVIPYQPEYDGHVVTLFSQPQPGVHRSMSILLSAEYRGDVSTDWEVEMPNLAQTVGFEDAMSFTGDPYYWEIHVSDRNAGEPVASPAREQTSRSAWRSGPPGGPLGSPGRSVRPPSAGSLAANTRE